MQALPETRALIDHASAPTLCLAAHVSSIAEAPFYSKGGYTSSVKRIVKSQYISWNPSIGIAGQSCCISPLRLITSDSIRSASWLDYENKADKGVFTSLVL